jgi:hypothetical protein
MKLGRLPVLLLLTASASAHIGSPDTFVQTEIGSYKVLLSAHPPATFPGALELDLRFNPDDRLTAVSAWLDAAEPTPIVLVLDGTATTSLWVDTRSAHTLHLSLQGSRGPAGYSVTLPAAPAAAGQPSAARPLPWLVLSLILLIAAVLSLRLHRPRQACLCLLIAACLFALVFRKPPPRSTTTLAAVLAPNGHLGLSLASPQSSFADLVPDHGKLLHLFLIREPNKDVFLHLHPVALGPGRFNAALPAMPPGTYALFADFYHANGSGETSTLLLTLPQQTRSATTDADDSTAVLPPLSLASAASVPAPALTTHTCRLPDGYTMQLLLPTHLAPLRANLLVATLLDPAERPPGDMALYLGMSAHAVVLRQDDAVFAHIHPGGTLPMLMPVAAAGSSMSMPPPSNAATIPYGFPSSGRYRVFIQMKHGHIVETAAFDLRVD